MGVNGKIDGVSVVVPAYNGSSWIASSLQSILSQDCDIDIEVVVVDDCSSDDTLDVVRGIGDPRIVPRSTGRNSGVAAARNLGISLARHEWIAFNDQDDVWLPGRIGKQLAILEAHPDMEAVAGGAARLAGDGKSRWTGSILWWKWSPQHVLALCNPPYYDPRAEGTTYLQTLIVSRSTAQAVGGFNENLPLSDDLDFFMRIANVAKLGFLQEPVFLYRLGQHNQTAPNVAKAAQFLGAQAYYVAAMQARNQGTAVPMAAEFMAAYVPRREELVSFDLAQQVRAVNTIWVNQGLVRALLAGMGTLCRHPRAFMHHFMSRVQWWRGAN